LKTTAKKTKSGDQIYFEDQAEKEELEALGFDFTEWNNLSEDDCIYVFLKQESLGCHATTQEELETYSSRMLQALHSKGIQVKVIDKFRDVGDGFWTRFIFSTNRTIQ